MRYLGRPGRFVAIVLLVLATDLATKLIVHHTMSLDQASTRVIGNWVRLTYIHNPGAAFSLFQGSRWFFVGISALSILVVISLARHTHYQDATTRAAFALILGGAIGNLLDRLWLGVVIDFLDIGIGRYRWPVFNVADIGVTVGIALLACRLFVIRRRPDLESETTEPELDASHRAGGGEQG